MSTNENDEYVDPREEKRVVDDRPVEEKTVERPDATTETTEDGTFRTL